MLLQGETQMLLTRIPHFRELTVCSFECPHCGTRCVHARCSNRRGLHPDRRFSQQV